MPTKTATSVEPCPVCGSLTFNPLCPECLEVKEQSLVLGAFHEAKAAHSR
jgi:hypothetical protein